MLVAWAKLWKVLSDNGGCFVVLGVLAQIVDLDVGSAGKHLTFVEWVQVT